MKIDNEIDKNYDYFMNNLETLYAKYRGKFLVLKNAAVVAAYDDLETAYREAVSKYRPGEFSIQESKSDRREGYIENFHNSNVRFA